MSDKAEGEEPEERGGAGGFFAIYMTLGALVFYVLSPAPVIWVFLRLGLQDNYHAKAVIEIFYAPIGWAFTNIPAANAFYDWQFRFLGLI